MKLLRDFVWLRALRGLRAGCTTAVRRPYTVTVPAPLADTAGEVVELRRYPGGRSPSMPRGGQRAPLAQAVNQ